MTDSPQQRTATSSKPPLLSVVIPAYNVERYVKECIDSVLYQSDDHSVDIIFVIDGATDKTKEVAERALQGTQAKIIYQPNLGLSAARNRGLSEVTTEYVCFLDSDDYWLDGFLETTLSVIQDFTPDIVEFDAMVVDEEGNPTSTLKISASETGVTRTISHDEFLHNFRCYAWARVTRTSIARCRGFPYGRRFEDAGTIPWHYRIAHKMVGIGNPLIAYRQRHGSIISSPSEQDVLDLAFTTAEAAREYSNSRSAYWAIVANRIHQIACRRTLLTPPTAWPRCIIEITKSIEGVPPSPGCLRWLQIKLPFVYIALLSIKRGLQRPVSTAAPKLFGRALK
ncbi:MAG: glycosyltransferase [Zoogloeaceae bacterium]|nr:glycosyltransferase [Zoogloeaceae bacterium]